jgi:hypothetical protein
MSRESMTLGELLDTGVELTPVFDSPLCNCFRVGFYYNGSPHAIGRERFRTSSEAQEVIQKIMQQYRVRKQQLTNNEGKVNDHN